MNQDDNHEQNGPKPYTPTMGSRYPPKVAPPLTYQWPHYIPVAPFPVQTRKISPFNATSLILGILALASHWVVVLPKGYWFFIIPLSLSIIAMSFGFSSTYLLIKSDVRDPNQDRTGLLGFNLGMMALMFATSWLYLFQTYLWGWGA